MKAGWQTRELADLCDVFADGDWVESKDQSQSGVRLIQTGNVGEGTFKDRAEKARYISEATFKRLRCTEIFEGDCLVSRLPDPVGRTCILPSTGERMITAVDCTIIRFKKNIVLPEFFNFYSQSINYLNAVDGETSGTTRKRISRNKLGEVIVPIPPLHEQQRLLTILDEAFERIATAKANAEKNLQNAREVFESHLQSVFSIKGEGWVESSLEELGTITSSKRIFKSEYVASGVPFYRTKEVKQLANGRPISTELFIAESRYQEIEKSFGVPKPGDILLTAIGTIGEIYVVEGGQPFYFKDGNVLWLKDFYTINPNFLKYVLMSFVDRLNKMAHGSAYSALPIQRLNAHRIFVPPSPIQEAIVLQLDSLREETLHLESIYQMELGAFDELKQSLLHRAFSGNL